MKGRLLSSWAAGVSLLCCMVGATALADAYQDGSRYYLEGKYTESVEAFEEYVQANPKAATAPCALYGIGIIHEHQGNLTEAIDAYRRLTKDWPASHSAREAARKLVALYEKQGNWASAADGCITRIGLLETHHPEHITLREAVQIVEECVEAGGRWIPGMSREEWLDVRIAADRYPLLDEAFRVVRGPDPRADGNLLRNPGFELDGKYVPDEAPIGWHFQSEQGPYGKDQDGVLDGEFLSGYGGPRSGALCVGKYTSWGLAHGRYLQTVRTIPGERYDCAVYAMTRAATGSQGQVRLGVDPTGGADPTFGDVVWTEYQSTNGVYRRIALDGQQAVTAQSNYITLFLELRQDVRAAHNVMLFDDASIVKAGAPKPDPQEALQPPPPPPTPTPFASSGTSEGTRMGYDAALLTGGLLLLNEPSVDKIEKHPEKFEEWKTETLPDICRKFRGCGMVAARVGLCWYNIEREKDVFDWSISDEMVFQLEEHGIVHVACIATSPVWALDPGAVAALKRQGIAANLIGVTQIKPECWDDYEAYMERLVLRYRDCIDHWEIWNEPDGMAGHKLIRNVTGEVTSVEFGGDPDWLLELLKRSARPIRALDPCGIVCIGGFEDKHPPKAELLEGVYARGGKRYFDAVGIHTYGTPLHREWFCFLRQVMVDHGEAYKSFWVTEYGMRAQKDVKQAYKVRRSIRALREIPYVTIATGHIANMLWNGTGSPGYQAHQEMAAEKGPRPVFRQDFEGGAAALLQHWEWDTKAGPGNQCWLKEGLEDVFPEQGDYYLTGRSNGMNIAHILDTYVRPTSQNPAISFSVIIDPEPVTGTITLDVTVEPSDVCKQPKTVTLFESGVPCREWVRVEVPLFEHFPEFRDDVVMAVTITARAQEPLEEWEFAIDDIRIE
jgi:hypothetical protein